MSMHLRFFLKKLKNIDNPEIKRKNYQVYLLKFLEICKKSKKC